MHVRHHRPVRRICSVVTLVVTAVAVLLAASVQPASAAPTSDAVTSCISTTAWQNAAHTSAGCELTSSRVTATWTTHLNGQTSYPVLAAGKVFVTTSDYDGGHGPYGGYVSALNAATGRLLWGPVRMEGTYYSFNLTYQQGRVFVSDYDGTVRAFAADTGAALWTTETSGDAGLPVAFGAAVYLQATGSVFKLDASSGRVIWSEAYPNIDGSLAVTDRGVFVGGSCARYRLSLDTGRPVWADVDGCSGGPAGVTYVAYGLVFDSIGHRVYSSASGQQVGEYGGQPAFTNRVVYSVVQSRVVANPVAGGASRWVRDLPEPVSAPVVAGGTVWVASAGVGAAVGHLYGLSAHNGTVTRTLTLPAGAPQNFDANIAVGQGRLVVAVADTVVAYS